MLGSLHATHSIQSRHGLGYMCGIQGARHTPADRSTQPYWLASMSMNSRSRMEIGRLQQLEPAETQMHEQEGVRANLGEHQETRRLEKQVESMGG
uniref:Uncharacterized protein n=1 Tax=Arundo donax TaxID=35708 RepID=A0A0A9H7I7_ARUDO